MAKLEKYLKENQIDYILHEHPAAFTCEDADKFCTHIPGLDCKNLFLKTRKGRRHILVILPANKRADLKQIAEILNEKKVSFANAEVLQQKLGVAPGSVSPFCLINDPNQEVEVYLDKEVSDAKIVGFHPNINTATLELEQKMFQKFLDSLSHDVIVIDLKNS